VYLEGIPFLTRLLSFVGDKFDVGWNDIGNIFIASTVIPGTGGHFPWNTHLGKKGGLT
jgi:hypothetical protein